MSLKSKIITKIKQKVKADGSNLSNVRINGLADKLDAIIENEDDIDAEIEKLDKLMPFKELAALDDAKRNADKKKAEEDDEEDGDEPESTTKTEKQDKSKSDENEMPAWFKAHVESQNKVNEELTSQLSAFKQGQTIQTRRQQLEEKLQDAPDKFKSRVLRDFDRLKIDTDEDFTNYLADIEQDVADEIQAQSDAGLGSDAPFAGAGGPGGKIKEASQSEIDELFGEIKI